MARTTLGIGSYSMPIHVRHGKMNAFDIVDIAREKELKVVQIADNISLSKLSMEELETLRGKAKLYGITLETGLRGIMPENLERHIELTHALDSHLLRAVIDAKDFQPTKDEIHSILKKIQPKLEEYDITLGIENHDRFYSDEFKEIIRKLKSKHFGIVLDTANSLSKEEPISSVLDNLAPYSVCFHIKDYKIIRNPYGMGLLITGTPAGKGRLDIPGIIKRLEGEAQSDFSSIIEFWIDEEKTLDDSLEKEDRWLDESIRYMKGNCNLPF